MTEKTVAMRQAGGAGARSPSPPGGASLGATESGATAVAEFERIYRANVEAVTSYFARRSMDPHAVADLVADTFVTVITSFGSFDPGKGTARAWVFGIARHVYAGHCQAHARQQHKLERLAGRRDLAPDQVEELLDRIDAERVGRDLVTGLGALPDRDRAVVELVDIAGLSPKEAAAALGLTSGAVRMRLMRTRAQLRKRASAAKTSAPPGSRARAATEQGGRIGAETNERAAGTRQQHDEKHSRGEKR